MSNPKHLNTGKCEKCLQLMGILGGTDPRLVAWFTELQSRMPDAHIAFAGRSKADQEEFFKKKTSNAHYGESPHNFAPALAIDIFRLTGNGAEFNRNWYIDVIRPEVVKHVELSYGGDWKRLKDYPHVEIAEWKELVKQGKAKLNE